MNLKKSQSKCNSYVKNRVINPAGLDVICNSKFQSGWEKLQIEGHLPPDLGRRRRGLQLCQFLHSLRNHCTNLFVNFHLTNYTRKTTPTHIMKTTTYSFSTNCFFFLLYQLNLKPYWTPQTCSVSFIKKAKPPHQPTLSCFVYTKCRLVEEGKSIFAFLVYRSLNLSRNEEEEEYCVKKKKKCFSPCEPSVSKLTDGIIVYQSEVLGLVAGQFVGHGHGKIKWFRRVLVARRWILVPFARALLIGSVDRLEQKAARRIQGTWALCCHPPIVTCVNCLFVFYHFFF